MFARLRRHPWLAALLLILSPASAGVALPLLHPCPVDAPWVAAAGSDHQSAGHHAASDGPAPSEEHHCSCIGCGSTPPRTAPPTTVIAAQVVAAPVTSAWPVVEGLPAAWHILLLLPEATAPPLA